MATRKPKGQPKPADSARDSMIADQARMWIALVIPPEILVSQDGAGKAEKIGTYLDGLATAADSGEDDTLFALIGLVNRDSKFYARPLDPSIPGSRMLAAVQTALQEMGVPARMLKLATSAKRLSAGEKGVQVRHHDHIIGYVCI